MNRQNYMKVEFTSRSENEAFARVAVSAFITQLDPTLEELEDVKTAVSEAVTNAIIHGYENEDGVIYVACTWNGQTRERDPGRQARHGTTLHLKT